MEPNDKNGGSDEQGPGSKRRAPAARKQTPAARKRPRKAVNAAEQNGVGAAAEREIPLQTAYDVKEIHRSLSGFSDDDLKQIPIVAEGTQLEQGATYIDLAEERPTEVKVNAGVVARAGQYYVPKNRVPYTIWNRLIGEAKPGQELSGATDRSSADVTSAGEAAGERPDTRLDRGGSDGNGTRDADQAAQVAADLKSWMDARKEDRDEPREVL